MDAFAQGTPTAPAGSPDAPGGGMDQQRQMLLTIMQQMRDFDGQIDQVFGQLPSLAPIATQMHTLVKRAVQEAVKAAPQQTASSEAVPMGAQ